MCLQPGEHGMTKPSVPGPARELYTYRERGLHPVSVCVRVRDDGKGRGFRLQRVQLLPDQAKLRVGKPRRHASDIAQLTLFVGDADQQGAEERTGTARLRPAANDACVDHGNSKCKMQNANSTQCEPGRIVNCEL